MESKQVILLAKRWTRGRRFSWKFTDVSEELTTSIVRAISLMMEQSTRLHSATSQKIVNFIPAAVRT
jgi:hypothetical protein